MSIFHLPKGILSSLFALREFLACELCLLLGLLQLPRRVLGLQKNEYDSMKTKSKYDSIRKNHSKSI